MQDAVNKYVNTLAVLKWMGAGVLSIWAGVSPTVHVLIILMSIDYATGLAKAIVLRRLSADVSGRGIVRKIMTLVLVYAGHIIEGQLGIGLKLGETIAIAYSATEFISVVENCADMGVYVPPVLLQTLAKARAIVPKSTVTTITTTETVTIPQASTLAKPEGRGKKSDA